MLQYDILGVDLVQRLRFATSAMHAYGHEWACQLVYNSHLTEGLGLSNGEGTERLWSRLIRLIGIEWSSSVHNFALSHSSSHFLAEEAPYMVT